MFYADHTNFAPQLKEILISNSKVSNCQQIQSNS